MLAFLKGCAAYFASSFLQFLVGYALALLLGRLPAIREGGTRLGEASGPAVWGVVFASALLGCALPLGPAGAVPLAAAALGLGFGAPLAIPFLLSNLLFDSLAPFSDPTFIWRTGYLRVVFALLAGTGGGLLALRARKAALLSFRSGSLPALAGEGAVGDPRATSREAGAPGSGPSGRLAPDILVGLGTGAAFLALGALADLAFRRYALGALMGFAYASPAVSFVPDFFATRNVVNPFFLQTMRIVAILTNFGAYAALALILRPRGLLRYIAYFAAWAVLLGLSAFF